MSVVPINIINATPIDSYRVRLVFDDGVEQTVDFKPFLSQARHPAIRAYLDLTQFLSFRIEYGELVWGDYDLCFPVIDLYRNDLTHGAAQKTAA